MHTFDFLISVSISQIVTADHSKEERKQRKEKNLLNEESGKCRRLQQRLKSEAPQVLPLSLLVVFWLSPLFSVFAIDFLILQSLLLFFLFLGAAAASKIRRATGTQPAPSVYPWGGTNIFSDCQGFRWVVDYFTAMFLKWIFIQKEHNLGTQRFTKALVSLFCFC